MTRARDVADSALVHIATETFSAVASQAVESVFSATYDSYKIIIVITGNTGDAVLRLKLRNGATDDSTSYTESRIRLENTTITAQNTNLGTAGFFIGETNGADNNTSVSTEIEINDPFKNTFTSGLIKTGYTENGCAHALGTSRLKHETQGVINGLKILQTANTISGRVSVYGYRK